VPSNCVGYLDCMFNILQNCNATLVFAYDFQPRNLVTYDTGCFAIPPLWSFDVSYRSVYWCRNYPLAIIVPISY